MPGTDLYEAALNYTPRFVLDEGSLIVGLRALLHMMAGAAFGEDGEAIGCEWKVELAMGGLVRPFWMTSSRL